jgi:ribosomal protein S18 acetylase RimI-like enzyme
MPKAKEKAAPKTVAEEMDYQEFLTKYVERFRDLKYVFWPDKGFIVWRVSTGENVELLHIRTFVRGKGYSRELIREMVLRLKEDPPYYSIFGFALSSRTELKAIYQSLGFNISEDIVPPYKGGNSFIFWQDYKVLKKQYSKKTKK